MVIPHVVIPLEMSGEKWLPAGLLPGVISRGVVAFTGWNARATIIVVPCVINSGLQEEVTRRLVLDLGSVVVPSELTRFRLELSRRWWYWTVAIGPGAVLDNDDSCQFCYESNGGCACLYCLSISRIPLRLPRGFLSATGAIVLGGFRVILDDPAPTSWWILGGVRECRCRLFELAAWVNGRGKTRGVSGLGILRVIGGRLAIRRVGV